MKFPDNLAMSEQVTLDQRDANLSTQLSDNSLTAKPLVSGCISNLWSGVKGNSSASAGKPYFIVTIGKELAGDAAEGQPEVLIGVSTRETTAAQLGSGSSWAYASSGRKWTASKAEPYGPMFAPGDEIGCFLDLNSDTCTVSFTFNGTWLGSAYELPKPDHAQGRLYPHIMLKRLEATVNFTDAALSDLYTASEEPSIYKSWTAALEEGSVSVPSHARSASSAGSELLVMVGLPGSGKSTWATRYAANHPEKQYALLSIDGIIKQLKGSNQTRGKQKSPDAKTQQLAEQAYQELLDHIESAPGNYVLDDSNVYEEVRSARVSKFRKAGFKTRAAVIVLPDSSLFRRQRKQHQEEGKSVPETTIADMRANFSMPEVGEVFQEVFFVEAKPPEAHDIAAAQAEAAKAALPMLKARSAGGRQTRSRTAKTTPKRASAPAKKASEEKKADAEAPTANGSAAGNPSTSAATSTKSRHTADSPSKAHTTANITSTSQGTGADSELTEAQPAAAPDTEVVIVIDQPDAGINAEADAVAASADVPMIEQPADVMDLQDATATPDRDQPEQPPSATTVASETETAAAAADNDVAGEEAEKAVVVDGFISGEDIATDGAGAESAGQHKEAPSAEAVQNGQKHAVANPAEAEAARPGAEAIASTMQIEDLNQISKAADKQEDAMPPVALEGNEDVKPSIADALTVPPSALDESHTRTKAEPSKEEEDPKPMEEDSAAPTDQPEPELAGIKAEGDKPQVKAAAAAAAPAGLHATEPATQVHDKTAAASDAAGAAVAADGGISSDKEVADAGDGGGGAGADGRGVKRPAAAAVIRAAKQARTTQAAGRLLGNIRGTVKRTVIRGRVGARPPGMRLPPPISTDAALAVAAEAHSQDKANSAEKAAANGDKAGFKDVMQQLLPAEQDLKSPLQQPSSDPTAAPEGSSEKQDGKQPQRASSSAKASTDKRIDQGTTKPAGPADKDRQDHGRSQSTRREASRPQPAPRHGGRNLPPAMGGRQGPGPIQGHNRHQGRDRPAPRGAPLGPRDAGIQKGRRRLPQHERHLRKNPSHALQPEGPRGQLRNGPQAGHRPGQAFASGPPRTAPSWNRNVPPPRQSQPPARLPPPVERRAPVPQQGPSPANRAPRESFGGNERAPRDSFGGNQSAPNLRVPARAPGPDRAAPPAGFPVGRRAGPVARQAGAAPPQPAPRNAPVRARTLPPAAHRDSYAPPVTQPRYEPQAAPFPPERHPARYSEQPRYNEPPSQRAPRAMPGPRGTSNRPTPAGQRSGVRAPPAQPFSPPGPSRLRPQQARQHPASYGSPVAAPVSLPPPRMGPLPGAPVPGLAPEQYTPRGRREAPSSHLDRPRSRSRGPPATQRGTPYPDRPTPRGRQPAAQQLRTASYPEEQPVPEQYLPEAHPRHAQAPPQYEQPMASHAPEPYPARRGPPDRAPLNADRYASGPAVRGPQQWQKPDQAMAAAPGPGYQQRSQGPPSRDKSQRQQGYAPQPIPAGQADRRMDRRGRGARDRGDMRHQQRPSDRLPPNIDSGRYAPQQGHVDQEYAPGLAPDGYIPRDARSHGYTDDPRGPDAGYMPPQQHVKSPPPRYDSPLPAYAPPLAQEQHQPVYGSGAAPMQGYNSTVPPADRQPYYPQQQQGPPRQAPGQQQQQQYVDAPQYGRESAYSSAPGGYDVPQGGYMDPPPGQGPSGGYSHNAPASAPRHHHDEYDAGYSGRDQGYAQQARPSPNVPVGHGGPRGGPRSNQAWAPSPRESAYGGAPHASGGFAHPEPRQQGGYENSSAHWSGGSRHAPQDSYPPHQQIGSSQMHGPSGAYRR